MTSPLLGDWISCCITEFLARRDLSLVERGDAEGLEIAEETYRKMKRESDAAYARWKSAESKEGT